MQVLPKKAKHAPGRSLRPIKIIHFVPEPPDPIPRIKILAINLPLMLWQLFAGTNLSLISTAQ